MIGLGSRRSWGEKFKSAIIEIFFRGLSLFKGQRDFMVAKEEYKRGVFFLINGRYYNIFLWRVE